MKALTLMLAATLIVVVVMPAWAAETAAGEPAGPALQSFDNLLPNNTIFVLSVRNMPELLGKLKETAGYKILDELNLLERLTPPQEYAEMQNFYGTFIEPLGGICSGEVAVAITNLEGLDEDKPQIALLIDVSKGETALDEFLNGTVLPLLAEHGVQPETQELAGVKVTKIDANPAEPDPPIFYAVKDGLLVVTLRADTMGEILSYTGPGVARAMLPSNVHYAGAKKALGRSDVMLYVNLAPILAKAKAEQTAKEAAGMKFFGLDTLQNIAFGMALGPDGGTSTIRFTTNVEPTIWLGGLPGGSEPFKSLRYMPQEAGFCYAVKVGDLKELYTRVVGQLEAMSDELADFDMAEFETGIGKIEAVLGMDLKDDVLAAFGGEVAFMAKVPEAIGVPPAALMIEVKDEAKAEAFVARAIELLGAVGQGIRTTSTEYKGVQIVRVLTPPPVAPGVAIVGDFLVVGTSAEAVKAVIDAQQGGVGIASRPDFKASMAGLPTTGTALAYIDLKAIYDLVFPLVASRVHGNGEAGELVEALATLGEHLSGMGLVVSGDETGVTYRIHSQSAMLEPMVLFGTAAAVPAVFRAREAARGSVSMANVRQLCMAAIVYEQDHGELPEKMGDLAPYVGAPVIFVHPRNIKSASLIDLEKPETIDQYTDYELVTKGGSLSDIDDPSTTVLIQEKEPFAGGTRAKGYVDGHVTGVPEPTDDEWIDDDDSKVKIEIDLHEEPE